MNLGVIKVLIVFIGIATLAAFSMTYLIVANHSPALMMMVVGFGDLMLAVSFILLLVVHRRLKRHLSAAKV